MNNRTYYITFRGISKRYRFIASALITLLVLDSVLPTAALAITGHDSMPEYRSFEPVATTNMVNLFSGQLTYNVPLLEVPGGYPINLAYHSSDVNNEALASWVGLGWNINPGSINRMKKGFPDEFRDKTITYHNRMPANWTVGINVGGGSEFFGGQLLSLNAGYSIRYNNYNGLGTSVTGSIGIAGVANLNASMSNGVYGFDAEVRPGSILNAVMGAIAAAKAKSTYEDDLQKKAENATNLPDKNIYSKSDLKNAGMLRDKPAKQRTIVNVTRALGAANFTTRHSGNRSYPATSSPYTGAMVELQFDAGINFLPPPIDLEASIGGSFTIQKTNNETLNKQVYGYLHSDEAYTDKEAMMDYMTENENPFEKRDNVLGYPMPNNDLYSLSGEAMGGSFRAFRNDVGHYRKDEVVSEDFQVNAGADVNLASIVTVLPMTSNLDYTVGADVGGSYHKTTTGAWVGEDGEYEDYLFNNGETFPKSGEKYYWRFAEDKAGYFDQTEEADWTDEEVPFRATLSGDDFEIPWTGSTNYVDNDRRHQNKRNKRSTYVLQHLNTDFAETNQSGVKYKVYEKKTKVIDEANYGYGNSYILNYDHSGRDPQTPGEFVTYNNDGSTYVYGLPVYARNEKQLQYSFPGATGLATGPSDLIRDVTSGQQDSDYKRKVGTENQNEYATAHLLTQILGSDYIDRTGNGPSSDDFGSFTKFNYYRVAGGSDWYSYRTPYTGVNFDYGSLSSNEDDMGGFSYGEKEVYYLHSVVSKTHVAIFTLGDRADGESADLPDNPSAIDVLKGSSASATPMQLKKLVRIDLYSIKDCELPSGLSEDLAIWEPASGAVPLKTVHFDYDDGTGKEYTLCKSVDNNAGAVNNNGKLTLRKVWFEHGGRIKAKISPYIFHYKYYIPTGTDAYSNTAYGDLQASEYGSLPDLAQNPDYNPANTDRWGNYRDYATMSSTTASPRHLGNLARFWPFVHQNPDPSAFDPAAYCLKRIELPSGGEIHIQYEQADYAYVQDKKAMMMVPLKGSVSSESGSAAENKKYYLDLGKVGIDYSDLYSNNITAIAPLANDLFEPMLKDGKRMYFNFLYAIIGDQPDFQYTHSDFIEGFARINGFGYDANGIFFAFKGCEGTACANNANFPSEMFTVIGYPGGETSRREFPNKVCKEFYKSQRRLKIDGGSNASTLESAVENNDAEAVANAFVNVMERILDPLEGKCKYMDPAMSFIRIQVPQGEYRQIDELRKYYSKLGAGVRVKRLISFDKGIDGAYDNAGGYSKYDNGVIYGNEYIYTTRNPETNTLISSGVATNEPASGRRESALVNPIDKDAQSKANAVFYGRDMYGLEGPLGESVLPGPSIGYSRVEIRPIYNASNGLGSEVHEFYTVQQYPFESRRTIVQQTKTTPVSASIGFAGVSISYEREAPNMAQGYHFINHSMHGKQKSVKKFGHGMEGSPYYSELYEYFEPDDNVTLMGDDLMVNPTPVTMKELGQETELLFESRRVYDWAVSAKIGADLTGGVFTIPVAPFVIPFIYPSGVTLGGGANETIFDTHVSTTITTYPALLKRTVRVQEGIAHYSENLIMDEHSGQPVVVRTYDDFYSPDPDYTASVNTGIYINQQFRGSWKYDNLKSRFYNEDLVVNGSVTYSTTGSGTNLKEYLKFNASTSSACAELQNFVRGDYIELLHTGSGVWLYHVDEVDYANNRLYIRRSQFSDGSPTGTITGVHVIRSGYTNRLGENVGSIVLFNRGSDPAIVQGVSNLDANHPLVEALNNSGALQNLTPGNNTTLNLSLNTADPDYKNLNMSAYASEVTTQCASADPADIEVTDVDISVEYTAGGELKLTITSFTFLCNGEDPVVVTCPN